MERPKKGKFREVKSAAEKEFEQRVVDIARVTRVVKGGKRMSFRACIVVGNRKGKVGFGIANGQDATIAINKAATKAKKRLAEIPIKDGTIAHEVRCKFKAAKVLIRPAPLGTGLKAGGALRVILELLGIENITSKMQGSKNKINNVKAAMEALKQLCQ